MHFSFWDWRFLTNSSPFQSWRNYQGCSRFLRRPPHSFKRYFGTLSHRTHLIFFIFFSRVNSGNIFVLTKMSTSARHQVQILILKSQFLNFMMRNKGVVIVLTVVVTFCACTTCSSWVVAMCRKMLLLCHQRQRNTWPEQKAALSGFTLEQNRLHKPIWCWIHV